MTIFYELLCQCWHCNGQGYYSMPTPDPKSTGVIHVRHKCHNCKNGRVPLMERMEVVAERRGDTHWASKSLDQPSVVFTKELSMVEV